jgi:hypothetical protein
MGDKWRINLHLACSVLAGVCLALSLLSVFSAETAICCALSLLTVSNFVWIGKYK